MDRFPPEILRQIFRQATLVPSAFNCIPGRNLSQDEVFQAQLSQSFSVKCALSLVSRQWHALSDEFLYEIIHLRHLPHLATVLEVLIAPCPGRIRKGWWCRQLDISIKHWQIRWEDGQHDLWGLLPACPRLATLSIDFQYRPPPFKRGPGEERFYRPSLNMLQTIVTLYGSSLRIIELGRWIPIQAEAVIHLLPHLPVLEGCRLQRLIAFEPVLSEGEEGDSEEEDSEQSDASSESSHSDHYLPLTASVHATYNGSLRDIKWPAVLSGDSVRLPFLRILECRVPVAEISDWDLPSLQEVVVAFEYDYSTPLVASILFRILKPHAAHITHFTYGDGPTIDIWGVLDYLPSVKQLVTPSSSFAQARDPCRKHQRLTTIRVKQSGWDKRIMVRSTNSIFSNSFSGLLPSLEVLEFYVVGAEDVALKGLKNRYRALGVNVQIFEDTS